MNDYEEFLQRKEQLGQTDGFEPEWIPDFLFDFQKELTTWAIRKGRSAIFADCGLGKTPMQLVWAENIVRKENRPVLILTPLAVSHQTIEEAHKFGIEAYRCADGKFRPGINVVNYERLHYFDPNDFAGCVCDESSILKSFDGVRRKEITEFMKKMRYRLLCTATAAPNDYIELGTSSEALGELGHTDMLNRFFKNDQNTVRPMRFQNKLSESGKWRFRGHAEIPFWRWVSSWARSCRKPSDLGFDDDGFILPELIEEEHHVDVETIADGFLFNLPAIGLKEQRAERRRSINERCEKMASLVSETNRQAILWCHLNDEGDKLESLIKDSKQVSGKDSDDRKEELFFDFVRGNLRVLVTKAKIGAWGLNFQHCSHVACFPSHSFEQYYQSVRRCWRYGQKENVKVDIITTKGEANVLRNLQRKGEAANKMFASLCQYMNDAEHIDTNIAFTKKEEVPNWLQESEKQERVTC